MDNDKSLTDALLSKDLTNKMFFTSANGTIILSLLSASGLDKIIASSLVRIVSINQDVSYWLVYLLGSILLLAVNLYFTYRKIRVCVFYKDDWHKLKAFAFQKRLIYNFSSKSKEMREIPKYMIAIFIIMCFFGVFNSLNSLIFMPLQMLSEGVCIKCFKFAYGTIYHIYILSNFIPYLLLTLIIFIANIFFNLKSILEFK